MKPEGESPLLLPANQHKQLVVIDFEYSNANVPGLEFANHFVRSAYLVCHLALTNLHRPNGVTTTTTLTTRSHARRTTILRLRNSTASSVHTSCTLQASPPLAELPLTLPRLTLALFLPPLLPPPLLLQLLLIPFLHSCWTHVHLQGNLTRNRKLKLSATRKKRSAASWPRPSFGASPILLCG